MIKVETHHVRMHMKPMVHVTRIRGGLFAKKHALDAISLCNQSVEGQPGAQFAIAIMLHKRKSGSLTDGGEGMRCRQPGGKLGRRMQAEWEEHRGLIRGGISICRTNRYRQ